jgi:catalase
VGVFWRKVLDEGARARLIENMSGHLVNAAEFIQDRAVANFSKCDEEYGRRLREALEKLRKQKSVNKNTSVVFK